jgi:hypothetical protein
MARLVTVTLGPIHTSYVINPDAISFIEGVNDGATAVHFVDGNEIRVPNTLPATVAFAIDAATPVAKRREMGSNWRAAPCTPVRSGKGKRPATADPRVVVVGTTEHHAQRP